MKKIQTTFCLLLSAFCFLPVFAQQIPLKGVVTVQNSKTNTGKIQYVKNAEVTHPHAKNDVTDDDGNFSLNIIGVEQNTQTEISVIPRGAYSDYVVVNTWDLNFTLGRKESLRIYICKKGEREERQSAIIGINMKPLKDQIKLLQQELNALRDKDDYENVRFRILEDKIDSLSKAEKDLISLLKEWAESLTKVNLDEENENYVKAFQCFEKGFLDSVKFYLPDEWLEQRTKKALQQKAEGEQQKEMGQVLIEAGQQNVMISEAELAGIAKSWMLRAKTEAVYNQYEQAILCYEKAIHTDSLNADNIFEFAKYLQEIREYTKAENYYQQSLKIYTKLEKENPNTCLSDIAKTLNNLGALHGIFKEYPKALEKFEEVLKIFRVLNKENPTQYLPDLAMVLNNLALLHSYTYEYSQAMEKYEEALKIRRMLADNNRKEYLHNVAETLSNLAILYMDVDEYQKALEEFEKALKIYRELAEENPKAFLSEVARILNGMGGLCNLIGEYSKALETCEEALKIYRQLVEENRKVYLPGLAGTLNSLGALYVKLNEYPQALEKYEESLEIRRKLAEENPKVYLRTVANTLQLLAFLHSNAGDKPKMLEKYEEALKIYRVLAEENPKVYFPNVARILNLLGLYHSIVKNHSKALEEYEEALKIYKNLAAENPKEFLQYVETTLYYLAIFYQNEVPNKKRSLQYANEAVKILDKDDPLLEDVKKVIEKWEKK